MSPAAPRVAFYGFLGSGNLGNDASLETAVEWLADACPQARLRCITLAPDEVQARYGIPSVPLAACASRAGPQASVSPARKLAGRLLDVPRSLRLAGSVDAVVVPGMGVLEEALGVRPWGLPAWLFLIAASCRLRGRRFVLLDVGAEPVTSALTRRLFVATVRLATQVSYRDQWSADAMRAAGSRRPAVVAADLAFAHPCPRRADPRPGVVAVGVMAYYGHRGDVVAGAPLRAAYVSAMTAALLRLLDGGDSLVLLGGDLLDADVAHELAAALRQARPGLPPDRVRTPPVTTFTQASAELAGAEVVVASRFHTLIAALRLARPTVSVGYAGKSGRLMRSLSLEQYHQGIEELDPDWLVARVRQARQEAGRITAHLDQAVAGYAGQVQDVLRTAARHGLGLPLADGKPA